MKILLYDCESFPNVSLTWGTYKQQVIKVVKRRMVCSIAWMWYPEGKVETLALPDIPGYDPSAWNNSGLMKRFKDEVLNKADVAVAHNIDEFDDKMVNSDLFLNKLGSPTPHRTVDTLKVLHQRMRLNSNRLNDVCQELGIGKKVKHPGIEMWEGCMAGDAESWKLMRKYNAHDVKPLLSGLYEHVRPWVRNHPNMGVDSKIPCCPSCKNPVLTAWSWHHTQTGSYQRMFCKSCHSWCKRLKIREQWIYRP